MGNKGIGGGFTMSSSFHVRCSLGLLIIVVLLTGCSGSPVVHSPVPDQTKALLSIVIDWDAFDSSQPLSVNTLESPLDVTNVGARLVYVEENASVSQSVSKETAESEGVITLEVPPTQNANLFVAAVHQGSGSRSEKALYLGTIHGIVLQSDTVRNITVDDITWVKAEWYVHDTHLEDYLSGSFIGDKNEVRFEVPIRVRDPYQIGESLSRGNTVIKAAGTSSQKDNPDGWRRIDVSATNPKVGEIFSSDGWFWPYLDGSLFNLSETYYYIGGEGTFTVHWQ